MPKLLFYNIFVYRVRVNFGTGLATRVCGGSGSWLEVDVSDCQTEAYVILLEVVSYTLPSFQFEMYYIA